MAQTPAEFLSKAKEIVMKHKELQMNATALQSEINHMESEQQQLVLNAQYLFQPFQNHRSVHRTLCVKHGCCVNVPASVYCCCSS